jgi:hypothetical protein
VVDWQANFVGVACVIKSPLRAGLF